MKKYFILSMGLSVAFAFTSCKSAVTAQDVLKQESKANEATVEAQQELIELAQMKEQYSVDGVKAEIKILKKEKSKIDKDIKSLEQVSESTAEATKGLLGDLKSKSASISKKIETLEAQPKENWSESIESINQSIQELQQEVNVITANINRTEE
ncbi:hypothetical protein [Owenweeksia hongkongensis]|uniref:hypothetical protein n=1 Tax=Owenweeksia hongkongensis TaxID=253245 RepID=UPI003A920060